MANKEDVSERSEEWWADPLQERFECTHGPIPDADELNKKADETAK